MTKILDKAIQAIAKLPDPLQDKIGEQLLKWHELNGDIAAAYEQLDHGAVAPLDIKDIIAKARTAHVG